MRQLRLTEAGHHNPPPDIADGDTPYGHVTVEVEAEGERQRSVEVHPVEIFAESWYATRSEPEDLTVKDLANVLNDLPDEALIRVATSIGDGYLRCLDVNGVGYAAGSEEVNDELVVELITERFDSGHPIIRPEVPPEGGQVNT